MKYRDILKLLKVMRHLANASLARVDFLLTWNLKHLANASKFRQIDVLNARLGLPTPVITTPLTLTEERRPND